MPDIIIANVRKTSQGKIAVIEAAKIATQCRGWLLFEGVKDENGEPITEAFEIKESTHCEIGSGRKEWSKATKGQTFCYVLGDAGAFRFYFLVGDEEHVYDLKPGEALIWSNRIPHRTKAIAVPVKTLTVRTRN